MSIAPEGLDVNAVTDRPLVLFATPSLGLGGAERILANLVRGLEGSAFEPVLAIGDCRGQSLLSTVPESVRIVDLRANRVRHLIWKLIRLTWQLRPAIVFTSIDHLSLALCAVRAWLPQKVKIVVRVASLVALQSPLMRAAIGWLYPVADCVIFQSWHMKRSYELALQRSFDRGVVINNPIDVLRVRAAAGVRRQTLSRAPLELVCVGRFEPVKGFDLLAKALARFTRPYHLTIIGDGGAKREQFEALLVQLGISSNVSLVGYQDNPYPFIAAADALVLPSRSEGFPNVVLEALALGTPVVATPVAGIDELLGQIPSCIVADRIEPNALADALARFASRPHRDVPEGVVREYDLQPVIQCYVELLHRLTAT